jgi:type IV pilus assembly protein PilA
MKKKRSKLAIAAIVMACLFFVPLVPLIGAILGIVASITLKKRPDLGGRGAAVAAIPIGFVVFFVVQSMAAVAIPAFIKYMHRSKSSEAHLGLDRLRYATRAYVEADRYDAQGNLLPKGFPVARTGWVPASPCCAKGTRCQPDVAQWNASPWKELHFEMADPHFFQWRYESDGRSFKAQARGDLDCDGIYSEYAIHGTLGPQGLARVRGPVIVNELE